MTRQFIISSLVLLFTSSLLAQNTITERLVGKWEGTDTNNQTGGMEFIDSVHIRLTPPDSNLPEGTYLIDTTKKPMWLDITITGGGQQLTLLCLIEFIDKNTLKWQPFYDRKRHIQFIKETSENTLRLKRVNP